MNTKFYTKKEVAKLLKISSATLNRILALGLLKHSKVMHQVRISEENLNEYLKSVTQ